MSRIIVTGAGMITPAGRGAQETFAAMEAGVNFFDHRIKIGGMDERQPWPVASIAWSDIGWPDGQIWSNNKKYANYAGHAAVAAARQAVDGRIISDPSEAVRCGIVIAVGSTNGAELGESIQKVAVMADDDSRPLATLMFDESPDFSYVRGIPSQVGQFVSMITGFRGSNVVVYGESSAGGLSALSFAMRLIQSGELDRVMVVGVTPALPIGMLAALEQRESIGTEVAPGRGPFDVERAGTLVGQAAVAIVLEREGAFDTGHGEPLAELAACETLSAASRREAADFVVDSVLRQAGSKPGVWWACGAGSVASDRDECQAVAPRLSGIPVTSSKGTIGNSFECSGLIDVALAIESFARETAPPIGLLKTPDPSLGDIDFVIDAPRRLTGVNSALITALGSGASTTAGAAILVRSST
jgi:3-oxoacyl-[acyl-carrier-protein] synthase II